MNHKTKPMGEMIHWNHYSRQLLPVWLGLSKGREVLVQDVVRGQPNSLHLLWGCAGGKQLWVVPRNKAGSCENSLDLAWKNPNQVSFMAPASSWQRCRVDGNVVVLSAWSVWNPRGFMSMLHGFGGGRFYGMRSQSWKAQEGKGRETCFATRFFWLPPVFWLK